MGIFDERRAIKPYEYPKLIEFGKAILDSFWEVDEFDISKDVKDFNEVLTPKEKTIAERSMLAIAVPEVKVKSFWVRLDMRMPKPEVGIVGGIFGSNEAVHLMAYSKLLEHLKLEKKFETVFDASCMEGRVRYLNKYLEGLHSRSNKEFTKSLILFTLLVENVSLFSQFLIISSFRKYKNILKTFAKIVTATMKDEDNHGNFGAYLTSIIRHENPEWFDAEMEDKIRRSVRKAFKAETDVLDWIFEKGELDFMPRDCVVEYLKQRFNDSLYKLGYKPEYELNDELLRPSKFMSVQLKSTSDFDFFDSRGTAYTKNKSFDNIF